MQKLTTEDRTILFVSHGMSAITRLCGRAMWIDHGAIVADGPADAVVNHYLSTLEEISAAREWPDPNEAPGDEVVRLRSIRIRNEDGQSIVSTDIRQKVGVEMTFDVLESGHILVPNLHFTSPDGLVLFVVQDVGPEWRRRPRPAGRYISTVWIPGNFLSEGQIRVHAAVSTHVPDNLVRFYERDLIAFQVNDSLDGDSARGDYVGTMLGAVRPLLDWTTDYDAVSAWPAGSVSKMPVMGR
jgi:lipopolysaccharide transport system ATP-binding protein